MPERHIVTPPARDEMNEAEANYFAMCLLLPKELVLEYVAANPLDLADDQALRSFARKFGVTETLAAKRLSNMGLL